MGDSEKPLAGGGTRGTGAEGTVELRYKTRGTSSPQGKPRVFFACHPEDFAPYFEDLSDQVLKRSNCAIWYLDPAIESLGEEQGEDLDQQLSQMQLVVIPVTTKLLTRDCLAISLALPAANRHHVPVLPVMEESGLEELYARSFGDLQFLDPLAVDSTAIPYDEKLTRYLEGVLVGDRMADRVRAAFDAYVFMSYRKKDRKYAQQLMRLIHSNPLCWGIAVWYDEYLVPGEGFNSAIKRALEQSNLLSLVVTPSLLEEPNYVMDEEYPAARLAGKPVLPVEMAPTDPEALRRGYDGIDKPSQPEQKEVSERLLGMLKGVAIAENDSDPAHNFLIGLAYLDGIDVEVDRERAVRLITGAADSGLEEAICKLVDMYYDGKGVKRNYQTSIDWLERLTGLLRGRYRENPTEESHAEFFNALLELGETYVSVAKHGDARSCFEEMRSLSEEGVKKGYTWARRDLSTAYRRLGDAEMALGDLEASREWYRKGLEVTKVLAGETGTLLTLRDLCASYERLGAVEDAFRHPGSGKEWYLQALEIAEALAVETGTAWARRDLSVVYRRLGKTGAALGDPEASREWFRKALELSRDLADETGTVGARTDLAASYERLGEAEMALGDPEASREWFRKALPLCRDLADETGTVGARRDLAVSYQRLGDAEAALGDPEASREWYRKALPLRVDLADETGPVWGHQDLAATYTRLGDTEASLGHPGDARGWHAEALSLRAALADETGTVEARRDLSVSFCNMGDAESALGDSAGARKLYEIAAKIADELARETGDARAHEVLAAAYVGACQVTEPPEDVQYLRKACEIIEGLAKQYPQVAAYEIIKRDLQSKLEGLH